MENSGSDKASSTSGHAAIARRQLVSTFTGVTAATILTSELTKSALAAGTTSGTTTRTLPPQNLTLIGILNSLLFSTKEARNAFEKILNSLRPKERDTILAAFDTLLDAAVAATQGESSDTIWDALFNLDDVIDGLNLNPLLASAISAAASGIFCSLVCDRIPGYKLKDWFVSDFEFRLDTTRVAVTCIYTCPKMT